MQFTTRQHEMILDVNKFLIVEDYNALLTRFAREAQIANLAWFDECIEQPPAVKKPIVYGPQRNTRKGKARKY